MNVKIPAAKDEPKQLLLLRHPCGSHGYQLVVLKGRLQVIMKAHLQW